MDSDNSKEISIKKEKETKSLDKKRKRTESDTASAKDDVYTFKNEESVFKDKLQNISSVDDHGAFKKFSKQKQWKLAKIPHHVLPSFNLTCCTSKDDIRNLPLLKISLCRSVYVSSAVINDVDICHRRTIAMSLHLKRLKSVRGLYHSRRQKSKQVRKDEKNGIYINHLFEFAKRIEFNPDKYFSRDYDFYYTSGNLCAHKETNRILHVEGKNMDRINLSEFSIANIVPKVIPIASTLVAASKNEECEIFEVKFSKADSNTFLTRRKHCISLHQYVDENRFRILKKFESNEVPLISFDQDSTKTHHLAISDLDHTLRIYDIERGVPLKMIRPVKEEEIEASTRWNMVRSLNSQVYVYVACRKVYIIDTRISGCAWENNYCGFDEETYCSSFCSLSLSSYDNLFYVGSNHKVYCVDHRYMDKNIEHRDSSVIRWTHHMRSYPLMMETIRTNECEYIAAQSPVNTELCLFENIQQLAKSAPEGTKKQRRDSSLEYIYKSPCLPYMPQTLESVYREARRNGKGLLPQSGLYNRIKACNTGLCFVGENSNPFLLTSTSNGDVFARHMSDDVYSQMFTAADMIGNFEENIYRSVKKPLLNASEVCDLSGISKVFRCTALSDVKPDLESIDVFPKRMYMGRWQKSVRSLHKYKDALVSDLLSIWDVEIEEKPFNISGLPQGKATESDSFLNNWLNNTQDIAHSTLLNMTSIPMNVLNNISTDQVNGVHDTLDETKTSLSKPKVAKKKSRYVKGF